MLPVVILSGGLGTRLGKLAEHLPKSLIEICGKPFIEWQLKLLVSHGVKRIIYCTGHMSDKIKERISQCNIYDLEIDFSEDGKSLLGTGGAIRNALEFLPEEFIVLYGDSYLEMDYKKFCADFNDPEISALMSVYKNSNKLDRSNILLKNGIIEKYQKFNSLPEMEYIDYGATIYRRSCFQEFSKGKPFDLADLIQKLVKSRQISGFEVEKRFYEVGSLRGIEDFVTYIEERINDL